MHTVLLLERLGRFVTGRALRSDALASMVCRPFGYVCHGAPSHWDRPFLSTSVCVMRNVLLLECFELFLSWARARFVLTHSQAWLVARLDMFVTGLRFAWTPFILQIGLRHA